MQIFSDTISRPLTTKLQCLTTPNLLLGAAVVRFVICVPAFFLCILPLSAAGGLWPRNDAAFCAAIAVFSFLSGYLVTAAWQMATDVVPYRYRTQVANVCAVAFQAALAAALLLALAIRPLLFPDTPPKVVRTHAPE